jgi:hypothetical protein
MGQMSWRAPDELMERVRAAANAWGWSMNEYVSRVLDAATDPAHANSELERLRERLASTGLLAPPSTPRTRPEPAATEAARSRAGRGTPLSSLVSDGRR